MILLLTHLHKSIRLGLHLFCKSGLLFIHLLGLRYAGQQRITFLYISCIVNYPDNVPLSYSGLHVPKSCLKIV